MKTLYAMIFAAVLTFPLFGCEALGPTFDPIADLFAAEYDSREDYEAAAVAALKEVRILHKPLSDDPDEQYRPLDEEKQAKWLERLLNVWDTKHDAVDNERKLKAEIERLRAEAAEKIQGVVEVIN